MRLTKLALTLLIASIAYRSSAQDKPAAESFYSEAQHAIFRLECAETDPQTKQTTLHWGTGFLVNTTDNWYIVTAAHVAAEACSFSVKAPLALTSGGTIDARMELPHDKWEFHSEAEDVQHLRIDVAAMKIRVMGGGLKSFIYCPKQCAAGAYNYLDANPEPPDVVMTFGFPDVKGMTRLSRPLGRQGMVAFIDTIAVDNKWFDRHGFVIDNPTIAQGASGSPVIKLPVFSRVTLVGLISAANTNLGAGYAVAEPVSRIREVLDRLEASNTAAVDPWCAVTQGDAKKVNNMMPVCK